MSDGPAGGPLRPPCTIAFIGLGKMGAPMAGNLVRAGYRIQAFDASASTLAAFTQANTGARPCSSAAAGFAGAQAVVTMLPDGKAVRDVLLDEAAAIPAGAIVIDMSSSSPVDTQATGAALAKRGIDMIDAPVSGGVKRAVDGTLAIMVGGAQEKVGRCLPLLQVMGSAIFRTGPLGSGHAMKALNNYVSAAGLAAAAEALLIGRRFGLDPALMVDVLNASTGRNNSTENKFRQHILSGSFASGFALGLMAKDLRTAADLARHLGLPAPLSESCERLWRDACTALGESADHTELFRYLEQLGGDAPAGGS